VIESSADCLTGLAVLSQTLKVFGKTPGKARRALGC
jgi:hypothetical protein